MPRELPRSRHRPPGCSTPRRRSDPMLRPTLPHGEGGNPVNEPLTLPALMMVARAVGSHSGDAGILVQRALTLQEQASVVRYVLSVQSPTAGSGPMATALPPNLVLVRGYRASFKPWWNRLSQRRVRPLQTAGDHVRQDLSWLCFMTSQRQYGRAVQAGLQINVWREDNGPPTDPSNSRGSGLSSSLTARHARHACQSPMPSHRLDMMSARRPQLAGSRSQTRSQTSCMTLG